MSILRVPCGRQAVLHLMVKCLVKRALFCDIFAGSSSDSAQNESVLMTNVIKYRAQLTTSGMTFMYGFTNNMLLLVIRVLTLVYSNQN
jgi:hypothetical protein